MTEIRTADQTVRKVHLEVDSRDGCLLLKKMKRADEREARSEDSI